MNAALPICRKRERRAAVQTALGILIFAGMLYSAVFLSDTLADGVREGLSLCGRVVIPSLFPFMIFSDLLCAYGACVFPKWSKRLFTRIFGVSGVAVSAFFIGLFGGFPLGVRSVASLYEKGLLPKEEAERCIGFCNNTGPAFLIAGLGIGLFHDRKIGIFLWIAVTLSAILTGVLFKKPSAAQVLPAEDEALPFSLVDSIRESGIRTLTVSSFVVFFSAAASLVKKVVFGGRQSLPLCLLLSLLEVGSAVRETASLTLLPKAAAAALSGFAVGFSGISVHLQAFALLGKTDLRVHPYLSMKAVQGVLSAGIAFLLCVIFR